jgi:hypothetical protein
MRCGESTTTTKDGLRVSTTIRRLFSAIYDDKEKFATLMYFIGEVEYAERPEIEDFIRRTPFTALSLGGQAAPFAHTLCIKRPEFAHEDEVRLLIHDAEDKNRRASFSLSERELSRCSFPRW